MLAGFFLVLVLSARPQDPGQISNGTLVQLGDVIQAPAEGWRRPDMAKELLAVATVQSITYISDGLKVRGYLAKPKAKGKYRR